MKKILAAALSIALLLTVLPLQAFSASAPLTETAGMRLFAGGKAIKPDGVLLSMGGVVLVPVKSFLTGLGIPDESKYIKWDSAKKTVVVNWKGKSLTFKVGSRSAVVDGKTVDMGGYCVSYAKNKKVYVPLNFTAQALGNKVVNDDSVKYVYICDGSSFDKNMKLLKTVEEAMGKLVRIKTGTAVKLEVSGAGGSIPVQVTLSEELDRQNKLLHSVADIPVLDSEMHLESFYTDNSIYSKDEISGNWNITRLNAEDFDALLNENISLTSLTNLEVLAAGLQQGPGAAEGQLIFKGGVYPGMLIEGLSAEAGIGKIDPKESSLEVQIDSKTNLVTRLSVRIDGSCTAGDTPAQAKVSIDTAYTDPDGDFTIPVPEW